MIALDDTLAMVLAYQAGSTLAEVAERYSLCNASHAQRRIRAAGFDTRRSGWKQRTAPKWGTGEREKRMAAMYANGYTLQQIGDEYGISRERVRQILRLIDGPTSAEGGLSKITRQRRAAKKAAREARCFEKHGCSLAHYNWLLGVGRRMMKEGVCRTSTPIGAFTNQRSNARTRGIEWNLKLWEWWTLWQESGHWDERGLRVGQYVMARHGDTGPYEAGNVKIIQSSDNIREGYVHRGIRPPEWLEEQERFAAA